MKFNYQARDQKGQAQVGVIEASGREAALQILSRNGLFVTILEQEGKDKPFYARRLAFFDRVPVKEIMLFSRQLAILFKSEVPLLESLRTLSLQTKNINFKEKILQISEKVEGGTSLSEALSSFPAVFSPYYISIIKSGETSGSLSSMLNALADHLEREYTLTNKIRSALMYPAFVVFIGIAVLFLTMFFVIPNIVKVLGASHQQLPLATKIVIAIASFLHNWWLALLLASSASLFFLFRYMRSPEGKKIVDTLILKVPVIGTFLKTVSITRFAENLSTLIAGGLPIVQALEITQDVVGNDAYQKIIAEAKEAVRKGSNISDVLLQYPGEFPPLFTQMVQVGEKSGTLDTILLNIVDFYQKEVANTVDSLLGVLEPVLIVVLGLLIGGMMAAVLLPLYQSVSF